ncbi:zinc-dependent alcohol dehydrogenase family protein [Runella sp.]|uniref:zinc-dependent alcohol dehydrogenase family protein n=1 Tax=Runella sp. TaxID=1960881 RepID=UPI003D10FB54
MKKVVFHQYGKPADILNAESVEIPTPGPDEVLIKVLASPINPSDIMFVQNLYGIRPQLPSGAGFEGVGIVESVGSNAKVAVGTRVSFTAIGTWSEYVITNHRTLIPVPDTINDDTASQLFVNPFTAVAMVEESGVKTGEWLLVTACASALGKMVIKICKMRDIKTIGTVRRNDHNEELKALGVDEIINTEQENLPKRVQQITNYEGVRAVLECVGGQTASEAVKCMGRGAIMLIYGVLGLQDPTINLGLMIFRELTLKGFWLTDWMRRVDSGTRQKVAQEVITLLSTGQVKMPIEAVYSLDEIKTAVTHADSPGRWGKVLVKP